MISLTVWKYRLCSSRTSSASRPSEYVVKPTRSANSTLTRRRSATAATDGVDAGGAAIGGEFTRLVAAGRAGAAPANGVAHSEQNFACARFSVPPLGQRAANGVAHSMQKRAPTLLSVPQFEQITARTRITEATGASHDQVPRGIARNSGHEADGQRAERRNDHSRDCTGKDRCIDQRAARQNYGTHGEAGEQRGRHPVDDGAHAIGERGQENQRGGAARVRNHSQCHDEL